MAEAFNRMTFTLSHWHREARTRADQLQESYDRFRAVTDSANDAIVSVNRRGEIVFWNQRAQQVFGYDPQEALAQPLTLLMPERYRGVTARKYPSSCRCRRGPPTRSSSTPR
jgi:PAS domain S-box-containing protein